MSHACIKDSPKMATATATATANSRESQIICQEIFLQTKTHCNNEVGLKTNDMMLAQDFLVSKYLQYFICLDWRQTWGQ
jgi:hypothetical protein